VNIQLINYTRGISTTTILSGDTKDFNGKKCFLFDLDNTLILNKKPMKFAHETIARLNELEKDIYIVSNNNRYSPDDILETLEKCDIHIQPDHLITPLKAITAYLQAHNYQKLYVWGTGAAIKYFRNSGFTVTNDVPQESEIVIILYNNSFDYNDLTELAALAIDLPYVIGNIDPLYPDCSLKLPDTGCMWKFIQYCTNKHPIKIFGKPSIDMIDSLLKTYSKEDIVFIGDSDITDRELALNCKIEFIRVHPQGDISHLGVLCDYF
jgi:HAD superfamily hydrolase (TIGR01450 family)